MDQATAVRDFYVDRMRANGAPMDNVTLGGDAKVAIVHYDALGQRNVNAYLAHGQIWADLHFSCEATDATAVSAIDAALTSIKNQQ